MSPLIAELIFIQAAECWVLSAGEVRPDMSWGGETHGGGTGAAKHILIQSKQHGNRSHTELITIIQTNPITLGMLTLITLSPQSQWNAEEQITSKCDCYCAGLPGVPTLLASVILTLASFLLVSLSWSTLPSARESLYPEHDHQIKRDEAMFEGDVWIMLNVSMTVLFE